MARLILSFLRLLGACVLIAMGAAAMAAPCDTPRIDSEPKLPSVTRGQSVTVFGDCFSGHSVNAFLNTGKAGGIKGPFVAKATDDGKALNFEIQNDVQPGRYLITLDFGSPPLLAVPGELRVLSAEQAKVKIDSISPSTAYQSWRRFLRQGAKVGPSTRMTIAHEDPEAFYGGVQGQGRA
jgi:hypothetical protein